MHLVLLVTLSNDGVLLPAHLLRTELRNILLSIEQHTQRWLRRRRRRVQQRRRKLKPETETATARERHVGDEAMPGRRRVDASPKKARGGSVVVDRHSPSGCRVVVVLDQQRRPDALSGNGSRHGRFVGRRAVTDMAVDDEAVAKIEAVEGGTVAGGDVPGGRAADGRPGRRRLSVPR